MGTSARLQPACNVIITTIIWLLLRSVFPLLFGWLLRRAFVPNEHKIQSNQHAGSLGQTFNAFLSVCVSICLSITEVDRIKIPISTEEDGNDTGDYDDDGGDGDYDDDGDGGDYDDDGDGGDDGDYGDGGSIPLHFTRIHIHIHMQMHIHIHTHMHIHTHIHIHIHIHILFSLCR
jgi:hypothetical protein